MWPPTQELGAIHAGGVLDVDAAKRIRGRRLFCGFSAPIRLLVTHLHNDAAELRRASLLASEEAAVKMLCGAFVRRF